MLPPLDIRLFGPLDIRIQDRPLPKLRTRKGYWLLALLVLRQGRPVERDWIAGTLWPDSDQSQAYAGLRRALTDPRQAMGAEAARLFAPTPQTLCLDLAGARADVLDFDAPFPQAIRPCYTRPWTSTEACCWKAVRKSGSCRIERHGSRHIWRL